MRASRLSNRHVVSGTNALISLLGQITGAGQANANSPFHFLYQHQTTARLLCMSAVGRRSCRLDDGERLERRIYMQKTRADSTRAKPDSAQPLLVNKDAAERAHRQWRWCLPPIGANQASLPAPGRQAPNHGDQIQIRDRTDSQTPMII